MTEDTFDKIFEVIITMGILIVLFIMALVTADSLTAEKIGIEKVKCIDKHGNDFIDEYCNKEIYCSWLGLAGDKKCSEVGR